MNITPLTPPRRSSAKCRRCGLRYPEQEGGCVHCRELSDAEVEALKSAILEEQKANRNLGTLFLFVSALLVMVMLIYFL